MARQKQIQPTEIEAPAEPIAPIKPADTDVEVIAVSLNIRNKPSMNGEVLTIVHKGDILTKVGFIRGEWISVITRKGIAGYTKAAFVKDATIFIDPRG
jgi:hypothetical protein